MAATETFPLVSYELFEGQTPPTDAAAVLHEAPHTKAPHNRDNKGAKTLPRTPFVFGRVDLEELGLHQRSRHSED